MNRPVHFEFHSANPEATTAFFKKAFDWEINPWQGPAEYWLAMTGDSPGGINGGIMRSRDGQQRTVNTLGVKDVDEACAAVVAAGGSVCVPKMPIPGVGWLAYCTDPAGVLFGVSHSDPSAR